MQLRNLCPLIKLSESSKISSCPLQLTSWVLRSWLGDTLVSLLLVLLSLVAVLLLVPTSLVMTSVLSIPLFLISFLGRLLTIVTLLNASASNSREADSLWCEYENVCDWGILNDFLKSLISFPPSYTALSAIDISVFLERFVQDIPRAFGSISFSPWWIIFDKFLVLLRSREWYEKDWDRRVFSISLATLWLSDVPFWSSS